MNAKLTTNELFTEMGMDFLIKGRLWNLKEAVFHRHGPADLLFVPVVADRKPLGVRVQEDQLDWPMWERFTI